MRTNEHAVIYRRRNGKAGWKGVPIIQSTAYERIELEEMY